MAHSRAVDRGLVTDRDGIRPRAALTPADERCRRERVRREREVEDVARVKIVEHQPVVGDLCQRVARGRDAQGRARHLRFLEQVQRDRIRPVVADQVEDAREVAVGRYVDLADHGHPGHVVRGQDGLALVLLAAHRASDRWGAIRAAENRRHVVAHEREARRHRVGHEDASRAAGDDGAVLLQEPVGAARVRERAWQVDRAASEHEVLEDRAAARRYLARLAHLVAALAGRDRECPSRNVGDFVLACGAGAGREVAAPRVGQAA